MNTLNRLLIGIVGASLVVAQDQTTVRLEHRMTSDVLLSKLSQVADVIVVGVRDGAIDSSRQGLLDTTVRVDRVVKGGVNVGDRLPVGVRTSGSSADGGETALWFLSKSGDRWTVNPVTNSSAALFQDYYLPVAAADPAVRFATSGVRDSRELVALELASSLSFSGENPRWSNGFLDFAEALPQSSTMKSIYDVFASSSSSYIKALGIGGLLLAGEPAGYVRLAERDRLQDSPDNLLLAQALCRSRTVDAGSVKLLGTSILSKSSEPIAKCAAYVLRTGHSTEALPYLAELLNSNSQSLRYEGIVGLASFANNLPLSTQDLIASMEWLKPLPGPAAFSDAETLSRLPTFDTFREKESEYVAFWNAWWSTNKDRVNEKPPAPPTVEHKEKVVVVPANAGVQPAKGLSRVQ